MTSPLESSLALSIGRGMSGLFLDCTLERDVDAPSSPSPDPWDEGLKTTLTYSCKGIHEEYEVGWIAGGTVSAKDRRVLILASSLEVEPQPGDRITIRGETFTVVPPDTGGRVAVSTDPAKAVWDLRTSR